MLAAKSLDKSWAEIIVSMAKQAVESINPDQQINMNIVYFVKVKKVLHDCRFVVLHSSKFSGVRYKLYNTVYTLLIYSY